MSLFRGYEIRDIEKFRKAWQYDSGVSDLKITQEMDSLRENRTKFLERRVDEIKSPAKAAKILEQDARDFGERLKKQKRLEHKKAKFSGRHHR